MTVPVDEYFDVVYGVNLELVHLTPDPHGINFVARTQVNNGVVAKVALIPDVQPNPADTISVSGGGSVMESFLQKEPYYSGRDLFYLKPRIKLTDRQKFYYCLCLRSNKYKFNYGRQSNKTLPKLLIPSVKEIPSWVETASVPDEPGPGAVSATELRLDVSAWKAFSMETIFTISRGDSQYIGDLEEADVPYVSASALNNGVSYHVTASNNTGNKITLSYDGTIGEAFYQKDDFFASEKIAVLDLKGQTLNPYLAMFLIAVLRREAFRFNYGYKWSVDSRMKKTLIRLPAGKDGKPDWEAMEDFIKSLPYSSHL
jgi:hypothetical protein